MKKNEQTSPLVRKVTTGATYDHKKQKREEPKGLSLTVQGEAISVATMLKRLHAGMPVSGRGGEWAEDDHDHEDLDLEKFVTMDRFEQEMVLEGMKEVSRRYQEMISKAQETKVKEPKESAPPVAKEEGEAL